MKSSGRKALQPRNIFLIPPPPPDTQFLKKKKKKPIAPPHDADDDDVLLFSKEESLLLPVPVVVQSVDASLAEELSAFKKKLERLRENRDMTEKLLEERDRAMDLQMNHLLQRGEIQKSLEIQVDRLFRLKELHAYSTKISPIPSLRAKEQEKRKHEPLAAAADADEPDDESSVGRETGFSNPPIDVEAIQLNKGHLDEI